MLTKADLRGESADRSIKKDIWREPELQPQQHANLTSKSREGGREGGGREGTVGPGQSGLVVATGDM